MRNKLIASFIVMFMAIPTMSGITPYFEHANNDAINDNYVPTNDSSAYEPNYDVNLKNHYVPFSSSNIKIKKLEISYPSNSLSIGNSMKLSYFTSPYQLEERLIGWSVSDNDIATIDEHGVLYGLKEGEVTVSCHTLDGSLLSSSASISIYFEPISEFSISLDGNNILNIGDTVKINKFIEPLSASNKQLLFVSDNDSVAKVNSDGLVIGVGLGETYIHAYTKDGSLLESKVYLKVVDSEIPVNDIIINNSYAVHQVGDEIDISYSIFPSNASNKEVIYSSSDSSIASINSFGKIVCLAEGETTIKVTSVYDNNIYASAFLKVVSKEVLCDDIHITTVKSYIDIGETIDLNVAYFPSDITNKGYGISYKEGRDVVAISDGRIVGLRSGVATFYIYAVDGSMVTSNDLKIVVKNIPVNSISINLEKYRMNIGETMQYNVAVKPSYASNLSYDLRSSDNNVITIDNGRITARNSGNAVIYAVSKDNSYVVGSSHVITVDPIQTASIAVSGYGSSSLRVGDIIPLDVTITPSNATNSIYHILSRNNDIITVKNNKLYALSSGETVIDVFTDDNHIGVEIPFTVYQPVENLYISKNNVTIGIDESFHLAKSIYPSNALYQDVTYISTNKDVASVDENGNIVGLTAGSSDIYVFSKDPYFAEYQICHVVVEPVLVNYLNVTLDAPAVYSPEERVYKLYKGEEADVLVDISIATDNSYEVSVSQGGIVNVHNGKVVALNEGEVTLSFTANDASQMSKSITIKVIENEIDYINIVNPYSNIIHVGDVISLYYDYGPKDGRDIEVNWFNSNEEVLSNSVNNGNFTLRAVGVGQSTVKIVGPNNVSDEIEIIVAPIEATHVYFTSSISNMNIGDTYNLQSFVGPVDATNKDVIYQVSNIDDGPTDVLSLTNNRITALKPGEAKVTVSLASNPNVKDSFIVNVNPQLVTDIVLTMDNSLIHHDVTELIVQLLPEECKDTPYRLITSNENVLSIDHNNQVTANNVGNAIITCIAKDGSGVFKTISVNVSPLLVNSLSLDVEEDTIKIGEEVSYDVTLNPSNATDQEYEAISSDESIFIVLANNMIRGVGEGSAELIVTSHDGNAQTSQTITVNPIGVNSISISNPINNMYIGSNYTPTVTVNPINATHPNYTFTITDLGGNPTNIATIDNGVVTANQVGQFKLVVTSSFDNTKKDEITIEVKPILVSSLEVEADNYYLTKDDTTELHIVVGPSNATNKNVLIETIDVEGSNVLDVDNNVITATAVGQAIVKVSTLDGSDLSQEIVITVESKKVSSFSIKPLPSGLNFHIGSEYIFEVDPTSFVPSDAGNKGVTWSSTRPAVGTIDSNSGVFVATGIGTTTIRATTVDGSYVSDTIDVTVTKIPVESISVANKFNNIIVGNSVLLSVDVAPNNATDNSYYYEVKDLGGNPSNLFDVDGDLFTAVEDGQAEIFVYAHDDPTIYDHFVVTIKPIVVDDISITLPSTNLLHHDVIQAIISVLPLNAKDKSYTLSSTDENVLTVTQDGRITAVGVGSARIVATANDSGGFAKESQTIVVSPLIVNNIMVSIGKTTLLIGETTSFSYTVTPNNATDTTCTYESSNPSVFTVDNNKVITAVKEGTANLIITSNDGGYVKEVPITVNPIDVTSISAYLTLNDVVTTTLTEQDSATLHVSVLPTNATYQDYTVTSSDNTILLVDSLTNILALKQGSAILTITSVYYPSVKASINVTVNELIIPVDSLVLDCPTSLYIGGSATAICYVMPDNASNKNVIWSSSNSSVASISQDGVITTHSVGTTKIRVTSEADSSIYQEVTLTVNPYLVTSIVISGSDTLIVNESNTYSAQILPDNATDKSVTWSSSNTSVATINQNGVLTGLKKGTTKVRATANDGSGIYSEMSVNVTPIYVTDMTSTISTYYLKRNTSEKSTITCTIIPSNATDKTIEWQVSDSNKATVNSSGVVTPGAVSGVVSVVASAKGTASGTSVTATYFIFIRDDYSSAVVSDGVALGKDLYYRAPYSMPYVTPNVDTMGLIEADNVGVRQVEFQGMEFIFEPTNAPTYRVKDYNITANGANNVENLISLLSSLNDVPGMKIIKFENITYRFNKYFNLEGYHDFFFSGTFDLQSGTNTTFIFTSWGTSGTQEPSYILGSGCSNLYFKNIDFDLSTPPALLCRMQSADGNRSSVTVGVVTQGVSLGYSGYTNWAGYGSYMDMVYDAKTESYTPDMNRTLSYNSPTGNASVYMTSITPNASTGTLNITFNKAINVMNNQYVNVAFTMYDHAGFRFEGCNNIYFDTVDIYSAAGMGFRINNGSNYYFNKTNLVCKSDRGMTATADGIHTVSVAGDLHWTNSILANSHDDMFNVRSVFYEITDVSAANKTFTAVASGNGECTFDVGDTIEIYEPTTLNIVTSYTLTKVDKNGTNYTLTVDQTPNTGYKGKLLGNVSKCTHLFLHNCIIQNKRNRGILLQSRDSEISNCAFMNVIHGAIHVCAEYTSSWKEGLVPGNITLKNNIIYSCYSGGDTSSGVIKVFCLGTNGTSTAGNIKNVTITNNYVVGSGCGLPLTFKYAGGVIANNCWVKDTTGANNFYSLTSPGSVTDSKNIGIIFG